MTLNVGIESAGLRTHTGCRKHPPLNFAVTAPKIDFRIFFFLYSFAAQKTKGKSNLKKEKEKKNVTSR